MENDQRGQDADEEHVPAMTPDRDAATTSQRAEARSMPPPYADCSAAHARPRADGEEELSHQGGAGTPFAAETEPCHEAEREEGPVRVCERGDPGEERIAQIDQVGVRLRPM